MCLFLAAILLEKGFKGTPKARFFVYIRRVQIPGSNKWLWLQKTGIPKWVALVSGNMGQNLRSAPPG